MKRTRPWRSAATTAILAAAVLFLGLGPLTWTASAQVEENCNPPSDGEWRITGDKTVTCVDRTITVRNLTVTQGATLNLHGVTLLIDSKTAPNGDTWGTVMVTQGLLGPGRLNVYESQIRTMEGQPRGRLTFYDDVYGTVEYSEISQLDAITISGPGVRDEGSIVIRDSKILHMRHGIFDFGEQDLTIEGNFIANVDDTAIHTQGESIIRNNVITTCQYGIYLKFNSAKPVVEDNTITNCQSGIGQEGGTTEPQEIHENDIYENRNAPCPTCPTADAALYGDAENNWWGNDPPDMSRLWLQASYSPWRSSPAHPDRLPQPDVIVPSTAFVNEAISFDASASQPSTEYGFSLTDYAWSFGDGNTGSGSVASHSYGEPGVYDVRLLVRDEWNLSMPWSATVTIQNRAPSIEEAAIVPEAPVATDDLEAVASATDPDDDDVVLSYEWHRNGQFQGDLMTNVVPASRISSLDTWRVTVMAEDVHGAAGTATRSVVIPNHAPAITELSLVPEQPFASDSLQAVVTASDIDGDAVVVSYQWSRNGEVQDLVGAVVPSSRIHPGDAWRVQVTASDVHGATDEATMEVVIPNRVPIIEDLSVAPLEPRRGDALRAVVEAVDLDGDALDISYVWIRNGEAVDVVGSVVSSEFLRRGDAWRVEVTASDGIDAATATSPIVTVGNTAPEVESLSLQASQAGLPLRAEVVAVDVDGDAVELDYAWSQNGRPRSDLVGGTVPGNEVVSGDAWRVTVTPRDDELIGDEVSVSAVIGNHAPVIESLAVSPKMPTAATALEATVVASDVDEDVVEVWYDWLQNGKATQYVSAVVPVEALVKGDSWRVRATATDGKAEATHLSDAVTIQNTPPSITSVAADPTVPVAGEVVELSMEAFDIDGDALTVVWHLPTGPVTANAVEAVFAPGLVTVSYEVSDGEATATGSIDVDVAPVVFDVEVEPEAQDVGDVETQPETIDVDAVEEGQENPVDEDESREASLPLFVAFVAVAMALGRRR